MLVWVLRCRFTCRVWGPKRRTEDKEDLRSHDFYSIAVRSASSGRWCPVGCPVCAGSRLAAADTVLDHRVQATLTIGPRKGILKTVFLSFGKLRVNFLLWILPRTSCLRMRGHDLFRNLLGKLWMILCYWRLFRSPRRCIASVAVQKSTQEPSQSSKAQQLTLPVIPWHGNRWWCCFVLTGCCHCISPSPGRTSLQIKPISPTRSIFCLKVTCVYHNVLTRPSIKSRWLTSSTHTRNLDVCKVVSCRLMAPIRRPIMCMDWVDLLEGVYYCRIECWTLRMMYPLTGRARVVKVPHIWGAWIYWYDIAPNNWLETVTDNLACCVHSFRQLCLSWQPLPQMNSVILQQPHNSCSCFCLPLRFSTSSSTIGVESLQNCFCPDWSLYLCWRFVQACICNAGFTALSSTNLSPWWELLQIQGTICICNQNSWLIAKCLFVIDLKLMRNLWKWRLGLRIPLIFASPLVLLLSTNYKHLPFQQTVRGQTI